MMKKIVLHIGTPKTATTAIQRFLRDNYQRLLDNGVLYPISVLHEDRVHYPVTWAIEKDDEEILNKLKEEIDSTNAHTVILSSEMFASPRFHDNIRISKARKFLNKLGFKKDQVKILAYLRRQDHYAESIYNEMVKNHASAKLMRETAAFLDYYFLLKMWEQHFTKESILVGVYERSQFHNDIFEDFIRLCGLEFDASYIKPEGRENPGLTPVELELRRLSNSLSMPLEKRNQFNNDILEIMRSLSDEKISASKSGILSEVERKELLDMYALINKKVATEYLGREDGVLFYQGLDEEADEVPMLRHDVLVKIIHKLWQSNNRS